MSDNNNHNQNQNRNQNGFKDHANNNAAGFTVKKIERKKKTLKEFKQETKARWMMFKLSVKSFVKTSKKVFRFVMVAYVIISAIITSVVLTNPLNHWYTKKNPEKIEILRNATSYEVDEMINSYKRVDERTTEERKNEIEKQFQEVSDATIPGIKTAHAAPVSPAVETTAVNEASGTLHPLTAYNLVPGQTDSSPCIGAANQNLCYLMREKKMNVCAAPLSYPFGTIIRIPGYEGSQKDKVDDTCVVLDRMAAKHPDGVDICMDQDIPRALSIKQNSYITVVGYVENWRQLAPASKKEFQTPIR